MSLKNSCALLVTAIMVAFAWRYGIKIRRREIEPPLSTWILFLVGVGVSFVFYGLKEEWDLVSGIANTGDLVAIVPAIKEGNVLSAIYVIRAFVLILITFCFMTYFELRARRRSEAG